MPSWPRIDVAEVRLQAARILDSEDLRRAGKLRALLSFLVDEWLAFGDRPISQQRVAEVLGQTGGVGGAANAQARIYLWRLRHRMAAYAAGPGASDPLVLGVTAGPYRLSVEPRPAARGGARRVGRSRQVTGTKGASGKAKPAALVLTSELESAGLDGDLKVLPALVPRALTQYLLGKDGLVAIGPVPRHQISDPPCASPVARTSAAEYLLEGTLHVGSRQAGGRRPLEIVVRLHEIDSGRHIWSRTCTATVSSADLVSTAEMVAARLAATILAAEG